MENTTMMESSTESTIFTWTCDPRSQSSSAADLLRMINASGIGMQVQMYFPIALVVVMVIIFIEEVVFHVKNSSHWRRTIYTLWVLGVFPSLSFLSLLAIFIPRASAVIDFAAGFYYAIVLKKFFMLIIHLYGGKQQMENALKGDRVVSANPFPCCFVCCCHNQPMSLRRINILQSLVYQVVIIYPVCYFIQTVISAEGLLQDPATARAASFGMTLVGGILTISSFVCLYGFRVLSFASGYSLQQFHIRSRFSNLKSDVKNAFIDHVSDSPHDFLILIAIYEATAEHSTVILDQGQDFARPAGGRHQIYPRIRSRRNSKVRFAWMRLSLSRQAERLLAPQLLVHLRALRPGFHFLVHLQKIGGRMRGHHKATSIRDLLRQHWKYDRSNQRGGTKWRHDVRRPRFECLRKS
ncbi:uncharacterized protein LOC143450373 isoform X1 [Clavelina lepadiformis]|uniref:uncharacterized protein LOC143450373 isoform X1 n=1 Tax=Clavelina lepadiformis TaxID=159417 RepID=UPI00404301B6